MLLEKTTWCFACRAGRLVRKIETYNGKAYNFRDNCTNCGAHKNTHIETGIIEYRRTKTSER